MKDELKRIERAIQLLGLQPPYYIEYRAEDTISHSHRARV